MKTKVDTEVAHVTRDSDITSKVKGQLAGRGHIVVASRIACIDYTGSTSKSELTVHNVGLLLQKCNIKNFPKYNATALCAIDTSSNIDNEFGTLQHKLHSTDGQTDGKTDGRIDPCSGTLCVYAYCPITACR